MVQLYDFLGQGKDVFILSTDMGGWGSDYALWLSSGGIDDWLNLEPSFWRARQAVDAGDLYWVTLLGGDQNGGPTDLDHVQLWDSIYPHDKVPVLADPSGKALVGIGNHFPRAVLVDSQGRVLRNQHQPEGVLELAQARL